jgi:hypothetical protein
MSTLRWSLDEVVQILDASSLARQLELLIEASSNTPVLAELDVHGMNVFAWLAGKEAGMTILERGAPSRTASEWISVGNTNRKGSTEFRFVGQSSHLENRALVPVEQVRAAVLAFFESGRRSDAIRWEENTFRD